jgi:peptidyl-prolyl cis-trans isomerase B (cyclophilin B)
MRSMASRVLLAVPALVLLGLGLAACGDDEPDTAQDDATSSSPADDTTSEAAAEGSCTYTEAGASSVEGIELPPAEPTREGKVPVTMDTSVGELQLTLAAGKAPCTVNSFVSLAEQGYFDDTGCHRMTTTGIFVLQCGDPSGDGTGGPGYQFDDELSGSETYPAGTLAMANAGPNTNGSQFFIVYEDTALPPSYTVFGTVDDATVQNVSDVAADGTEPEGDGAPKTPVDINAVTVGQS